MAKTNKRKKSRLKSLKIKRYFKFANRTYWGLIAIICIVIAIMTIKVFNKYANTLDWEKMDPSVTMASQNLDMLYDKDPKSKKNKVEFKKLYNKMIDEDGNLTKEATKSNLKRLDSYIENMNTKNSSIDYKKMYAEVALKYSLNKQYEDLFADKDQEELKENVTPLTLAKLNETSFPDLKTLFDKNNEDKFVSSFIEKENKLIEDVESFNVIVDTFSSAVKVDNEKKELTLVSGYHDDLNSIFSSEMAKLNYNWKSTKYMNDLVTALNPVVKDTLSAYSTYDKYERDMDEKEKAYYSWKLTQEEFFNSVQSIHAQAVAEKHAKEEAERLSEELKVKKESAKESIKKFTYLNSTILNGYANEIENASSLEILDEILAKAKNENERIRREMTTSSSSQDSSSSTESSSYNSESTETSSSESTETSSSNQ